mmetsp:Transcript_484/g.1568  ORF Transcript_484/g.1568 Transcript_484/m.1568 type:complete len:145 (+) Transcript_484:49-483(+)
MGESRKMVVVAVVVAAIAASGAASPFPVTACPSGWRQAVKQSVWSSSTISIGTFPNYAVTYLAGTTDGSSVQVSCAQFVTFAGDGFAQWGPVTNTYQTFDCQVTCKNSVQSCPFIMCEIYHTDDGVNATTATQRVPDNVKASTV